MAESNLTKFSVIPLYDEWERMCLSDEWRAIGERVAATTDRNHRSPEEHVMCCIQGMVNETLSFQYLRSMGVLCEQQDAHVTKQYHHDGWLYRGGKAHLIDMKGYFAGKRSSSWSLTNSEAKYVHLNPSTRILYMCNSFDHNNRRIIFCGFGWSHKAMVGNTPWFGRNNLYDLEVALSMV